MTSDQYHKCFACEVSFTVTFTDQDAELKFCPHCGQESIDDVQLIEDDFSIDPTILYDDDEDDLH